MNCKIILLVFLISFLDYPSQNPKIDSLLKKIDNTSVNSSNIDGINQLASEYVNGNPDSTLLLSGQALQLSLRSKYKQGQMFAYKNMATAMSLIGEVDSSLI